MKNKIIILILTLLAISIVGTTLTTAQVVWEPQVGGIKITNCPTDLGHVTDQTTVSVTLRQDGNVSAVGSVDLVPATIGVLSYTFYPQSWATEAINPGDTRTYSFVVQNLMTAQQTTTSFDINVYDMLGTLTDNATVALTLDAKTLTATPSHNPTPTNTPEPTTPTNNTTLILILVVIALAVALSITILVFTAKRKKLPPPPNKLKQATLQVI